MSAQIRPAPAGYDVETYRRDFPILATTMHGKPLVYLDSGASAQKPRQVMDAMRHLYEHEYANIHRGVYWLSQRSTELYEEAREAVRALLGAASAREIVFTRNATEAINLVASSYGGSFLEPGDEVIISALEHHSNIVPWQMLRDARGIVLKVAPIGDEGEFLLAPFKALLTPRTRLVAVAHMSNALGTMLPVAEITRLAHGMGARVLLDGSQAAVHTPVDVQAIGCDFYVVTGHKLYGPSGIGALYARAPLLDEMPPYQGGGDMIASVTFEKSTWAPAPAKFEAGTPAIAQAVGLKAAIDYMRAIGIERIAAHEHDLLAYCTQRLSAIPGLRIIGTAPGKGAVVSFVLDGVHPHDIGTILDQQGVCVRAGHHCAQPVMERFDVPATVRATFGLYNTRADVDALARAVEQVKDIFA
ncbi:MAG: cysteine desulfurase [Thalassobaculales bacterium]